MPTKSVRQDRQRAGVCGRWGFTICSLLLAYVLFQYGNANPTREMGRLFLMLRRGIVGGEVVSEFVRPFADVSGNTHHTADDKDVANAFYNLASDFYEYGWGESFHFGPRLKGEPHSMSIVNSQVHLALKLGVTNWSRVLDMGCGIGGPLRGLVRLTGANVTGVTINHHQVDRAREITRRETDYVRSRAQYVQGDYLALPDELTKEAGTFDAVFYLESSLHTERRTDTFKEAFRMLRPGGRLVALEYVALPAYDEKNPLHAELMRQHLLGNGAARTPDISEAVQNVKAAGFEVLEHYDYSQVFEDAVGDRMWPWWADLQFNFRFTLLPAHPWVRHSLPYILRPLAQIGLIPAEVPEAAALMNLGGDGLSGLGRLRAITPDYIIVGNKPHKIETHNAETHKTEKHEAK